MKKEAYFATAEELARGGLEMIPPQMISGKHLIYSSPATLAFNSPGAEGFGVKRAGLAVPDSIMLIVHRDAAEEILLLSAPCRSTMIDFFI